MLDVRFELTPLAEIRPWGETHPSLHWFGLTDGCYWIEVNGQELLRYADATGEEHPYVDYYVARLWEDLLTMLPFLCEPVPDDLSSFVSSDPRQWREPDGDEEHFDEARTAAGDWHAEHSLDLGYLRVSPHLRCWRTAVADTDEAILSWTHQADLDIRFTAPTEGEVTIPFDQLVDAITGFHWRLMAAMDQRVTRLECAGTPADVDLDLPQLRREHQYRVRWLDRALGQATGTDWSKVRAGAEMLSSGSSQREPNNRDRAQVGPGTVRGGCPRGAR